MYRNFNCYHQIYSANIDGKNPHTVFFDTPVRARYIRIHPDKWHNKPALRLEVLGCFEAYATEETITLTTTKPIIHLSNCNVCPGITSTDCTCSSDTWWNGESCGLRSECPCVLGFMTYQVGTVYDLENCQQCTCTLGGLPDCTPKICAPCPPVSCESVKRKLKTHLKNDFRERFLLPRYQAATVNANLVKTVQNYVQHPMYASTNLSGAIEFKIVPMTKSIVQQSHQLQQPQQQQFLLLR